MTHIETASVVPAALRDLILSNPSTVLDDPALMAALIGREDGQRGGNVVDLRGRAIASLEERLARLEGTHRDVLAAAYDNVATTRQVHRAILTMIAPLELEPFLRCLSSDVAEILRVASVRLLLERAETRARPDLPDPFGVVLWTEPGEIEAYVDTWRGGRSPDTVLRRIPAPGGAGAVHRAAAGTVGSEALLRLSLGRDYPAALLVLGAADPDQYTPAHATDLIDLFARVAERTLRGLLP